MTIQKTIKFEYDICSYKKETDIINQDDVIIAKEFYIINLTERFECICENCRNWLLPLLDKRRVELYIKRIKESDDIL